MKKESTHYITPKTIKPSRIKQLRKTLSMSQREFAYFIGVSKPTVERWEAGQNDISGPVVLLTEILSRLPGYAESLKLPERKKSHPLRLFYMYQDTLCTVIDVDMMNKDVLAKNYHPNRMFCAFGGREHPGYDEYEEFLLSRCFPSERDKIKLMLQELDIPFYDPFLIIEKTEGRVAEDDFWISIEKTP